ncbi:MAG: ribonuclease III [Chthonomonadales bacterium]
MREADTLDVLQANLQVNFRDLELLKQSLRHRSASAETGEESNERLEFLGDAVLGFLVSDLLVSRFPQASEGTLAKAKAYLVSEECLAETARALGVDSALQLSSAEDASGGRTRSSILADAMEAVIAAIYLDAGLRTARRVVRRLLAERLKQLEEGGYQGDYKSRLQERVQAQYGELPEYRIVSTEGRDHDKTFTAQVLITGCLSGQGTGKSKKQAEQAAAKDALDKLEEC